MDRTARYLFSFPNRGAEEIEFGILSSPVLAFRFAQVWERAKEEGVDLFDEESRRSFLRGLWQTSESISFDRLGDFHKKSAPKALDRYLETISRLLKQWRACDQDPVIWWKRTSNAEQVRMVRNAVKSVRFTMRCERRIWSERWHRPPWASIEGESFVKPPWASAGSELLLHSTSRVRNSPYKVVKTEAFLRGGISSIEAARTAAYLLFSEVLVRGLRFEFCGRCDLAFLPGKKQKYCSKQCGHIDSGKQSKSRTEPRKNMDRVRVASQAIVAWVDRGGRRDWRGSVEKKLSVTKVKSNKKGTKDEYLIAPSSNKSQWLGRCIRAASSPDDSPKRVRLTELCTGPGPSEEERKKVLKDLNAFYALIRQAQDRERSFKAKRATTPAANAERHPAVVPG